MTRIEELQNQIIAAREAYYNGEPIMRDDEYDTIEDELLQLDPENTLLAEIGEDNSDGFPKAKHKILMGSQSKCNTIEQIAKKLESFSSKGKVAFLIEDKCDGCLDYDTLLSTDKGQLKIGEIVENKIKCNVKAIDMDTGKVVYTPIKSFFINQNDFDWYELQIDNGKTLKVTANHKVWLPKLNCWRAVEDLIEGDEFLTE